MPLDKMSQEKSHGQNATGQNATRKLDRRKKMPQQPRTKCHCLILRESNGDTVENTPQDSQMLLNVGVNVYRAYYVSADSLFVVVVSNWQNVIRLGYNVCYLHLCSIVLICLKLLNSFIYNFPF